MASAVNEHQPCKRIRCPRAIVKAKTEMHWWSSFKSYELKLRMHRWLSASDLKKVALFGCPSLGRKNVFSAKSLRNFFRIQEDTVCSKCVLKSSCKFVNQSVWKGNNKNLNLAVVMRVIILYAMESVPPQLVVPDEIKASVSVLLKEYCQYSDAQIWEMKCDDQISTLLITHAENDAKDCCEEHYIYE
ncbi:hypothetical protein CsSME_00019022 [Camellia sinensis var. sinensis]